MMAAKMLLKNAMARLRAVVATHSATRAALMRRILAVRGQDMSLVQLALCRWERMCAVAQVTDELVAARGGPDSAQALATSLDAQQQLVSVVAQQRRSLIIALLVLLLSLGLQLFINEMY
jgi:hypothetical protein